MKTFQTLILATSSAIFLLPQNNLFAAISDPSATVATIKAKQAASEDPKLKNESDAFNKFVDENSIDVLPKEQNRLRLTPDSRGDFPLEAKCTKWDGRRIHECWEIRAFEPSARVYFDTGSDDKNEVDIFDDGEIGVSLDVISFYLPWKFTQDRKYDQYRLGPLLAFGLTSPAGEPEEPGSGDEEKEVSGAPVAYFSAGLLFDYRISEGNSVGFETGYAVGFSADEGFDDNDDGAIYVGFKVKLSPFKFD